MNPAPIIYKPPKEAHKVTNSFHKVTILETGSPIFFDTDTHASRDPTPPIIHANNINILNAGNNINNNPFNANSNIKDAEAEKKWRRRTISLMPSQATRKSSSNNLYGLGVIGHATGGQNYNENATPGLNLMQISNNGNNLLNVNYNNNLTVISTNPTGMPHTRSPSITKNVSKSPIRKMQDLQQEKVEITYKQEEPAFQGDIVESCKSDKDSQISETFPDTARLILEETPRTEISIPEDQEIADIMDNSFANKSY